MTTPTESPPDHPLISLTEIISPIAAGNPGAMNVIMAVLGTSPDAGAIFLHDLRRCGLSGSDIYLLAQLAGGPLRAAALLHSCTNYQLPTLDELRAELIKADRKKRHPLPHALEVVITVVGERFAVFAGLDLSRAAPT